METALSPQRPEPSTAPRPAPVWPRPRTAVAVGWVVTAAALFHASYQWPAASFLAVGYLFALMQLARAESWRRAFYPGLAVGVLIGMGRLDFFFRIFSFGAIGLWFVYAFWIGLFVVLARLCFRELGRPWNGLMIPFVWCGLEYFRSELYFLRFSWLSPGQAVAGAPWQNALGYSGSFGLGFLFACVAVAAVPLTGLRRWLMLAGGTAIVLLPAYLPWVNRVDLPPAASAAGKPDGVQVAGVQMEFPADDEVISRLNELLQRHPQTELVVLSEYTFTGPVPDSVLQWCRENRRYLIVGGQDPLDSRQYYNTAFVIDPTGAIVFRQVKAVPIQFFKDGLPAPRQDLWNSPWGKIGICICYDLSYTRVTDALVELGAEVLIVPTMDVIDWGVRQHTLHARITPVRAAEYGLPVFRVSSSGVSQLVDRRGRVAASAGSPGQGEMIAGRLALDGTGKLPPDRLLGPFSTALTMALAAWFAVRRLRGMKKAHA